MQYAQIVFGIMLFNQSEQSMDSTDLVLRVWLVKNIQTGAVQSLMLTYKENKILSSYARSPGI